MALAIWTSASSIEDSDSLELLEVDFFFFEVSLPLLFLFSSFLVALDTGLRPLPPDSLFFLAMASKLNWESWWVWTPDSDKWKLFLFKTFGQSKLKALNINLWQASQT